MAKPLSKTLTETGATFSVGRPDSRRQIIWLILACVTVHETFLSFTMFLSFVPSNPEPVIVTVVPEGPEDY